MVAHNLTVWGIGTSRTMRVHWMLREQGLDYACQSIRPRSGETQTEAFLQINPKHKIPVLQHGPFTLTESAAILRYLSHTFPVPAGFFVPENGEAQARLDEWCYSIAMELDGISLYVIRRHGDLREVYGAAPCAVDAAREYFVDVSSAMLKRLPGEFKTLLPEGVSIADLLMVSCLDYAQVCKIEVPQPWFAYHRDFRRRAAYRSAFAQNFPERALPDKG